MVGAETDTVDRQDTESTVSDENGSSVPPPPPIHSSTPKDPVASSINDVPTADPRTFSPINPSSVNRFLTQGSFISRLSQYSGTLDQVDEIGKLPHHDLVKAKILKDVDMSQNRNMDLPVTMLSKYADLKQSPLPEEDCISEMSSSYSSLHNLALPTIMKNRSESERENARQPPDAQYNTTIEAPVPPRSKRRPLSENYGAAAQLESRLEKNLQRLSLDSALNLDADLTKLMHDASSIQSYKQDDEQIRTNTLKPNDRSNASTVDSDASTSSQYPESLLVKSPSHEKDSIELVQLPLFSSLDERRRQTKRLDSTRSLPPRPTRDNVIRPGPAKNVQIEKGDSHTTRQELWKMKDTSKNEKDMVKDETPNPKSDFQGKGEQDQIQNPIEDQDHEEEYIDIGAATPLSSPLKARPSTTKRSRRTINRAKSTKGKSPPLRPFSYSTLISLLESMNGTIIGQEFSQLDLPSHEKLLMEKIIDSLSRLTLEMVFDENRYHLGIQRLEKALRVLEGFD